VGSLSIKEPRKCESANKGGMMLTDTYLNEKQYVNLVAGIAILNDCKLLNIDFSEKVINIAGPPDAVRACSAELEKLLGLNQ
jgi:hypothetical protein